MALATRTASLPQVLSGLSQGAQDLYYLSQGTQELYYLSKGLLDLLALRKTYHPCQGGHRLEKDRKTCGPLPDF